MNRENGFAYQFLVLIIIIIIAVAGVIINKVVGKNGMMNQVAEVETKYNKEDVLEKINNKITQKFIELNNTAKENNQKISDLYNADIVIEFLKQNLFIQEIKDEEGNVVGDKYLINADKLYDEEEKVTIEGSFQLEKVEEKFMVVYYDNNENREEVGELQIQQT